VVQSRPITSLFPAPTVDDARVHAYLSTGHQQMMTEAMSPLALSLWQLLAARPMEIVGSRLFVDITDALAAPATRAGLMAMAGRSDPLTGDALQSLFARPEFALSPSIVEPSPSAPASGPAAPPPTDPAIVTDLIKRWEIALAELCDRLATASGPPALDVIAADLVALKAQLSDPRSSQAIMAAWESTVWLRESLGEWLGDAGLTDELSLAAEHNVTSDMGLALLDVADTIRPLRQVVELLRTLAPGAELFGVLDAVEGGDVARSAIEEFLARYGMRCSGEIDIARPRWHERPDVLVAMISAAIDQHAPGESVRRLTEGRARAEATRRDVLDRLGALSNGAEKASQTDQVIERLRTYQGYREYPKYAWMVRYDQYRRTILREAGALAAAGVLDRDDDVFFLRFDELRAAVATQQVDRDLVDARRAELSAHQRLSPPRVLLSTGEMINGSYRRDDIPTELLVGLGISTGVVEGRARVVTDLSTARVEPGDIVVTVHTDPSWSPLFVTIAGLVTEVGGLMTHGAVVAREYGLPTVVGVDHATSRIRDGQRIRIDADRGLVIPIDIE
jgi:rifampicin phosphotransferase